MARGGVTVALVGIPLAAVAVGLHKMAALPQVVVATRGYDLARTGWNPHEGTLTPANVTPTTFHKVGELLVDDMVEASPLFVGGATVGSGTRTACVMIFM